MFRKIIPLVMLLAALAFCETAKNWNGMRDTCTMPACSSTALVYSTNVFSMTDFDMYRLTLLVDDTTSAGFASDSVNLRWGYQGFHLCLNGSGEIDTCYSPRVIVDTINADSTGFGLLAIMTLDGDGIANTPGQQADTSSCSGFAVQSRTFSPEWDVYFRIWAQGITGNITEAPLKMRFAVVRRIGRGMIGK